MMIHHLLKHDQQTCGPLVDVGVVPFFVVCLLNYHSSTGQDNIVVPLLNLSISAREVIICTLGIVSHVVALCLISHVVAQHATTTLYNGIFVLLYPLALTLLWLSKSLRKSTESKSATEAITKIYCLSVSCFDKRRISMMASTAIARGERRRRATTRALRMLGMHMIILRAKMEC
ncbi:hypothetical protein BHM03_00005573 [Ensete ventricosum]|nr:hypothetical protein BHM03_00005573 [Ensete ventricosum]